jgi:hypothetical protein
MKWIRTDEKKEAVKGLEFVVQALKMAKKDKYYWKWVIIGLHNTLQSFIVCAISGSAGIGALKDEYAVAVLKSLGSRSTKPLNIKLAAFPSLYSKMKTQLDFSGAVEVDRAVDRLNRFRNDFIHFTPKGWSLQTTRLPHMTQSCLDVVQFLMSNPSHIRWYDDRNPRRVERLLKTAFKLTAQLK